MSPCRAVMVGTWLRVECCLPEGHDCEHRAGYQWPNSEVPLTRSLLEGVSPQDEKS